MRSIYQSYDVDQATVLLDNAIEACASDDVPEIRTSLRSVADGGLELLGGTMGDLDGHDGFPAHRSND